MPDHMHDDFAIHLNILHRLSFDMARLIIGILKPIFRYSIQRKVVETWKKDVENASGEFNFKKLVQSDFHSTFL